MQRFLALLEMADVVSRSHDPAEALLESEPLLTTYFNASRVGLVILDTSLRFLAINHALAEMNGAAFAIAENLDFDVPRPFEIFFEIKRVVAEGRLGLGARHGKR